MRAIKTSTMYHTLRGLCNPFETLTIACSEDKAAAAAATPEDEDAKEADTAKTTAASKGAEAVEDVDAST